MAAKRQATPPPDGDLTYRKLVERVVDGDPDAWQDFVARFSNLIFSLLWRYANHDQDRCGDLYLYVIEGLHQSNERGERFYRLRRYLDSVATYGGRGRLTTWLGRVTQNLVSDYFRELEGRKSLPRAIQRLDLDHQRIFKLLYWDGLPEREAFAVVDAESGGYERAAFDRAVETINRALKNCNRWAIYSEVIRKTPALPIHPGAGEGDETGPPVQVADPAPGAGPQAHSEQRRQQERAAALGRSLVAALRALNPDERTMLLCRFQHGMTAGQIAQLLGRDDEKRIYVEVDRLKGRLKDRLQSEGFDWEHFAGGIDRLDGLLGAVAEDGGARG